MKTATTTLATVLLSISLALAQKPPVNAPTSEPHMSGQPQTFPLWENAAPGALGTADEDIPTVTVYLPPHPSFRQLQWSSHLVAAMLPLPLITKAGRLRTG